MGTKNFTKLLGTFAAWGDGSGYVEAISGGRASLRVMMNGRFIEDADNFHVDAAKLVALLPGTEAEIAPRHADDVPTHVRIESTVDRRGQVAVLELHDGGRRLWVNAARLRPTAE